VWTKDKVRVNRPLAAQANGSIVQILQQVLLLERTLKSLIERLLGPENQVEQKSRNEKQDHQKRGKNLREDAAAARLGIAPEPTTAASEALGVIAFMKAAFGLRFLPAFFAFFFAI
jgi:hypothetical protein